MRVFIKLSFLSIILLLGVFWVFSGEASAIVVGGSQPSVPEEGFAYGNAVRVGSASGVYLGNGWVLTAAHVAANNITIGGTTYYYDGTNNYQIKNPTGYEGLDSTYTDLRLFRLTAKPDLPSLQLAAESPVRGSSLYYAGFGGVKSGGITYWTNSGDYVWTESATPTYFWGYKTKTSTGMSWGYNLAISDGDGPTPDTSLVTITSSNTDLIALKTAFNYPTDIAQAVTGDSGSPVFYEDPEDGWVLAGIVSCISTYQNAPTQAFVDSSTYSVALSFYLDGIERIRNPIPGDANRDGVVDGSDATILAGHWQQSTLVGSTFGDFNEDGIVDGSDATILAGYWQTTWESWSSDLATAGSGGGGISVPEPSTWILLLGLFFYATYRVFPKRRV